MKQRRLLSRNREGAVFFGSCSLIRHHSLAVVAHQFFTASEGGYSFVRWVAGCSHTSDGRSSIKMTIRKFVPAAAAFFVLGAAGFLTHDVSAQLMWDQVKVTLPYSVSIGDKTIPPGD